jgi:hypothetical protein
LVPSLEQALKKFAAEFLYEAGAPKFLVETQPGKRLHAKRQKGFANVKTWKLFAFEDDHPSPGSRQQGRCGTARLVLHQ